MNRFWPLICAIERNTELLYRLHDALVKSEPMSFVEKQIEVILQKDEEENKP